MQAVVAQVPGLARRGLRLRTTPVFHAGRSGALPRRVGTDSARATPFDVERSPRDRDERCGSRSVSSGAMVSHHAGATPRIAPAEHGGSPLFRFIRSTLRSSRSRPRSDDRAPEMTAPRKRDRATPVGERRPVVESEVGQAPRGRRVTPRVAARRPSAPGPRRRRVSPTPDSPAGLGQLRRRPGQLGEHLSERTSGGGNSGPTGTGPTDAACSALRHNRALLSGGKHYPDQSG